MTKSFRSWCVIAIVGIPLLLARPATAQDVFELWNVAEGLWTNDNNWTINGEPGGAPSLELEEGAQIDSGIVIIDAQIDESAAQAALAIEHGLTLCSTDRDFATAASWPLPLYRNPLHLEASVEQQRPGAQECACRKLLGEVRAIDLVEVVVKR